MRFRPDLLSVKATSGFLGRTRVATLRFADGFIDAVERYLADARAREPQASQPAVSPGLKMGIGIGSVVMPIIGLIMGIVYMVDANPEKKAAGKLWLLLACGGMAMYCIVSVASLQQ